MGALPHDFGYRYECLILVNSMTGVITIKPFLKSELDNIFQNLCEWESGFKIASAIAKNTLSVAGFIGWEENRKGNHNIHLDFPMLFIPEEVQY